MTRPHADAGPGYLLTHEAAAILQVSPKTVARWAKEGRIPFTRTLGGHRRYDEAEIRQLLADHTVDGNPFSGVPWGGPSAG